MYIYSTKTRARPNLRFFPRRTSPQSTKPPGKRQPLRRRRVGGAAQKSSGPALARILEFAALDLWILWGQLPQSCWEELAPNFEKHPCGCVWRNHRFWGSLILRHAHAGPKTSCFARTRGNGKPASAKIPSRRAPRSHRLGVLPRKVGQLALQRPMSRTTCY